MGRQGRLIFLDSCLVGPLVLSLSHVLFHLMPDILSGGGYVLVFFKMMTLVWRADKWYYSWHVLVESLVLPPPHQGDRNFLKNTA